MTDFPTCEEFFTQRAFTLVRITLRFSVCRLLPYVRRPGISLPYVRQPHLPGIVQGR